MADATGHALSNPEACLYKPTMESSLSLTLIGLVAAT